MLIVDLNAKDLIWPGAVTPVCAGLDQAAGRLSNTQLRPRLFAA